MLSVSCISFNIKLVPINPQPPVISILNMILMKQINILITGVGAPGTWGTLTSLQGASNYDITAVRGTYKGNDAVDGDGNEYIDVERFYMSLTLNGGCCDEGGLFGPWYIYGVGIVNPESDASDGNAGTAYAIGFGNGGFGQLTPGLLKLSGDLSTGEIEGFEYLTPIGGDEKISN